MCVLLETKKNLESMTSSIDFLDEVLAGHIHARRDVLVKGMLDLWRLETAPASMRAFFDSKRYIRWAIQSSLVHAATLRQGIFEYSMYKLQKLVEMGDKAMCDDMTTCRKLIGKGLQEVVDSTLPEYTYPSAIRKRTYDFVIRDSVVLRGFLQGLSGKRVRDLVYYLADYAWGVPPVKEALIQVANMRSQALTPKCMSKALGIVYSFSRFERAARVVDLFMCMGANPRLLPAPPQVLVRAFDEWSALRQSWIFAVTCQHLVRDLDLSFSSPVTDLGNADDLDPYPLKWAGSCVGLINGINCNMPCRCENADADEYDHDEECDGACVEDSALTTGEVATFISDVLELYHKKGPLTFQDVFELVGNEVTQKLAESICHHVEFVRLEERLTVLDMYCVDFTECDLAEELYRSLNSKHQSGLMYATGLVARGVRLKWGDIFHIQFDPKYAHTLHLLASRHTRQQVLRPR
jgi:hypothetical protein